MTKAYADNWPPSPMYMCSLVGQATARLGSDKEIQILIGYVEDSKLNYSDYGRCILLLALGKADTAPIALQCIKGKTSYPPKWYEDINNPGITYKEAEAALAGFVSTRDEWKTNRPEEVLEEMATGSKQHRLDIQFDLLDIPAIQELCRLRAQVSRPVTEGGNGYPVDNWRGITIPDNLNHAMYHIMNVMIQQQYTRLGAPVFTTDHKYIKEELTHAFCRVMFALAIHLQGGVIDQNES